MSIPRKHPERRLALVVALAAVLLAPATVRAAASLPKYRPTPTPRATRVAPPAIHAPLIVQCPIRPVDYVLPATDTPGLPAENPQGTPEPASVVSGLLGSGLALAAWVRRRRRLSSVGEDEELEETPPPG